MKQKIAYLIFIFLCVIHFLLLHYLGIASFSTTVLFYALIYLILKRVVLFFTTDAQKSKVIRFNIKATLLLLLVVEFSSTFIFKHLNNYLENEIGIYFSLYMRDKQVDFFNALGRKRARNDWSQGYEPFYTHVHKSKDFNYNVTYNEKGLRGKLPSIKKDSNEYRIVVLGDSFIEGAGAQENQTFPVQLNKHLLTKTNKNVYVINGGICGSNPLYEVSLYNKTLAQYKPDLVILEINLTDTEDYNQAEQQGNMPLSEYFKAISHVYRTIDALFHLTITDYRTSKSEAIVSEKIMKTLKDFNQQLIKNNQKLIVVYLAVRTEVTTDITSSLLSSTQKSGLTYINLQKEYKKVLPKDFNKLDSYYWKNDGHHTPKGYDLMAKTVAEQLIQKMIIK